MTVHQCRTCQYVHEYPQVKFSADSCGGGELTGKMITVCVKRNYVQALASNKCQDCRLWEIQEGQQTIAQSSN